MAGGGGGEGVVVVKPDQGVTWGGCIKPALRSKLRLNPVYLTVTFNSLCCLQVVSVVAGLFKTAAAQLPATVEPGTFIIRVS